KATNERPRLRLVFNKVSEQHSFRSLERAYASHLASHFDGAPLLSALPLEPFLVRDGKEAASAVRSFPNSVLARKAAVILRDLLHDSRPEYLTRHTRTMLPWMANRRRRSLGRAPLLLRPIAAMVAAFVLAVFIVGPRLLEKSVLEPTRQRDL